MSRQQLIREVLAGKEQPVTGEAIADALDGEPREKVYWALSVMTREGHLLRFGQPKAYSYTLVREVTPRVAMTREQAKQRKARLERERAQLRGRLPKDEYLRRLAEGKAARLAAKRQSREAAKAATLEHQRQAALARMAIREQAQAAAEAKRAAKAPRPKREAKPKPAPTPKPALRLAPSKPTPPPPTEPETVEQWMARTGKQPEVLPIGAVSQPLRFLGHRAENDASWRQRTNAA